MNLTDSQRLAIQARGNVLVVAGAGAGKTRTLVERCLDLLARERCDLTEILMVTFTDAAAAEMRGRVRAELQERAYALADVAAADHLRRQLALLDSAPIGTLHGFCLRLVRQHFFQLGIDPSVAVLDEKQTAPLITKALDRVLRKHYEDDTLDAKTTHELIEHLGQGLDEKIRGLVRTLHRYTQSLVHPEGWLRRQEELFQHEEPAAWREQFAAAVGIPMEQFQESGA